MGLRSTALVVLSLSIPSGAPPCAQGLGRQVETYVTAHQREIVGELADLLAVPNVRADPAGIRRNAELLRGMLAKRGFTAEVLPTAGSPLVVGEMRVPGATRTLLLYAHYDGQAVNPAAWKQATPFTPTMRTGRLEDGGTEVADFRARSTFEPDWRLYARSASDDKAPIVALLAAIDALKANGMAPTSNVRVLLDGEEESGSPSLPAALERYRDRLTADLMLFFDGPTHPSGRPTIVFGVRGNVGIGITVYGPKMELHSGHYGNWVANPAMRLAQLLATMKDDDGKVLVAGFYDGIAPLTPAEQAMLSAVPDDPAGLMKLFGVAEPERKGLSLQQALQLPTLNVRGLASADVGAGARTIIPAQAVASIDVRLVKETESRAMADKIRAHVRAQGYHLVDADPDDTTRARYPRLARVTGASGTNGYRTDPSSAQSRAVVAAVTRVFDQPPVLIRTMGGTLPIAEIVDALGFPAIVVPTVNFDNNQHSDNENIRLGHFFASIRTLAALLRMDRAAPVP
jgi:acetylornithine deacetylase/succinyl-diaminopimelate desuccinylase-like protein